jgi:hypothetical protein
MTIGLRPMHAEIAKPATSPSPAAIGRPPLELALFIAPAVSALLLLAAGVIAARRLAGALEHPLPAAVLVGVGLSLVLLGAAVRLFPSAPAAPSAWRRVLLWLPTAAVLLAGIALTLPGTPPGSIAGFWAVLIGGDALGHLASRLLPRHSTPKPAPTTDRKRRLDAPQTPAPHAIARPADVDEIPAEEVTQQLTRSVDGGGVDVLSGWLRAVFLTGQRTASVHVAFCPPFAKTPRLSVEQLDGPSARIKTAQLLPYGTRLDLKLSQPASDAADVLLRIRAENEA